MCCVQYELCSIYNGIALSDVTSGVAGDAGVSGIMSQAWLIDTDTMPYVIDATQTNQGLVDNQCTADYVEIPCKIFKSNKGYFFMSNIYRKLIICIIDGHIKI